MVGFMPSSITYAPIFDLISEPRLRSFDVFFDDEANEMERYGAYIWSQNASAALYPLMQQLEILLRNSVDRAARKRFGDYWWDKILVDKTKDDWNNFNYGINNAIKKLERKWKKKERERLNLPAGVAIPTPTPTFDHDDIVATTDFGTWKEIFISAHYTSELNKQNEYLWPKSMSKVFKRYDLLGSNAEEARVEFLRLINEIKDYRNRLFHHDCIWIKSKSTDQKSAIETIRHKINLLEKLIKAMSPITHSTLNTWGVFYHARRICSWRELKIYLTFDQECSFTAAEVDSLSERFSSVSNHNATVSMGYNGVPLCIHKLR